MGWPSFGRIWRTVLVVGFISMAGGMRCKTQSQCTPRQFNHAEVELRPTQSDDHSAACSTCAHTAGSAIWTVVNPGQAPLGFVRIRFNYLCKGDTVTGNWVDTNVPVSAGTFRTADQGAKNRCGENADIYPEIVFWNDSPTNRIRVVLGVACSTFSGSTGNPVAPGP